LGGRAARACLLSRMLDCWHAGLPICPAAERRAIRFSCLRVCRKSPESGLDRPISAGTRGGRLRRQCNGGIAPGKGWGRTPTSHGLAMADLSLVPTPKRPRGPVRPRPGQLSLPVVCDPSLTRGYSAGDNPLRQSPGDGGSFAGGYCPAWRIFLPVRRSFYHAIAIGGSFFAISPRCTAGRFGQHPLGKGRGSGVESICGCGVCLR
jgi:hypothetical protein